MKVIQTIRVSQIFSQLGTISGNWVPLGTIRKFNGTQSKRPVYGGFQRLGTMGTIKRAKDSIREKKNLYIYDMPHGDNFFFMYLLIIYKKMVPNGTQLRMTPLKLGNDTGYHGCADGTQLGRIMVPNSLKKC